MGVKDLAKTFISGIVIIGLVTAVGTRAGGLAKVGSVGFRGSEGLLSTAEKG